MICFDQPVLVELLAIREHAGDQGDADRAAGVARGATAAAQVICYTIKIPRALAQRSRILHSSTCGGRLANPRIWIARY
jgi:hypothetical protein